MPTYRVTDPSTGKRYRLTGDSPPTEQELNAVFGSSEQATPQTDVMNQISTGTDKPFDTSGLLPLAGGLAGGLYQGGKAIWGMNPIRIGLSGLGGAAGEGYHQIYQHVTGDPNAPQTSGDALSRMGTAGAEMALGEGAGQAIVKGIASAFPKVRPEFVEPGLQEAKQTFQPYVEQYAQKPSLYQQAVDNIRGRMGQNVESRIPAFTMGQQVDPLSGAARMENIARASFFGGTPIKEFEWAQKQGLTDFVSDVTNKIWKGAERVPPSKQGEAFLQAHEAGENAISNKSKELYGLVDKATEGVQVPYSQKKVSNILDWNGNPMEITETGLTNKFVDISGLKRQALQEAKRTGQFQGIGSSETADKLHQAIANLPDRLTFSDAQELRSRLIKSGWSLENKDVGKSIAFNYVNGVDKAMETSAKNLSPEAYNTFKTANDFYRNAKDTFNSDYVMRVIRKAKESPEDVGRMIFKNGEVNQIREIKNILNPQPGSKLEGVVKPDLKTWQNLKAGWVQELLGAAESGEGKVNFNQVFTKLRAMAKNNPNWWESETVKEILTPKERQMLRTLEVTGRTTQKQPTGQGGTTLVQIIQAGPLAYFATAQPLINAYQGKGEIFEPDKIALGIGILGAPRVLGKMMVSPKYQKLFLQGMSTDKARAIPAINKLAVAAYEEYGQSAPKQASQMGGMEMLK